MKLDILPGEGVGPIRRDMQPAEVLAAFSEAQVYEKWMGGNLNDSLFFQGLVVHFTTCNSIGPLPDSVIEMMVIHQRDDAHLFGRPVHEWTKDNMWDELKTRGYDAKLARNGNIEVFGYLCLSFGDDGSLLWVEVYV